MNMLFVLLMVISFAYTIARDWKGFKKENTAGKITYGLLGSLVLLLLFSGIFDYDVMYPTKWIIYGLSPYIRGFMFTVQ